VPGGELGPDEQAEPVGVGEIEVGRPGQLLVELAQLLGLDAKAAVVDLHCEAVGHPARPDLDLGTGGGVQRRVLDQLGQQVDHVGHGRAHHRVLGRRQHRHAPVVFHLGDRGPDHVDDRHRLVPRPPGCRTGQDGEALRVPGQLSPCGPAFPVRASFPHAG